MWQDAIPLPDRVTPDPVPMDIPAASTTPGYRVWRSAVTDTAMDAVDPVVHGNSGFHAKTGS